ncbi:MAG: phosphatase domain-containing protein [Myxococcota bacterium]
MSAEGSIDRSRLVYRWDLDKTYLRTEFDTVRDLLRTAFEPVRQKQTVPGAAALLREVKGTSPAGIYILSGSPEQMRRRLEAKLRLDGVHWDSFVLKPSLRNLLRGRFRFLRDQVGYKLEALLGSRLQVEPDTDEILFGDDAEADGFIYSLYADICADRVGNEVLMQVLRRAQVYEQELPSLVRMMSRVPHRGEVRRIFIHLDRVSPPDVFADYGQRLCPFYNYFQPALVLLEMGCIDADAALRVGAEIVVQHGFAPDALTASFIDLARRDHVGRRAGERILAQADAIDPRRYSTAAPVLRAFADELAPRVPDLGEPHEPEPVEIDYVRLFDRDQERSRAAKARAILRRSPRLL